MEINPVRRATSVPLRHNSTETDIGSVERDFLSSPFLSRNFSDINSNIPMSDPVARTASRGSYQLSNYKISPKRPSETVLPNLPRDTSVPLQKPQIRTPLLANKLPTFRRPHSNPNLTTEKRTYTQSGDVIVTKKTELELTRVSKSAQNVKRFPSAPTARLGPIPVTNLGSHGYNTLTSTPNNETSPNNNFAAQELTTPIIARSPTKPVLESTVNDIRQEFESQTTKLQTEQDVPEKVDYLKLIQDFLASKKSNFNDHDDTSLPSEETADSEVTQLLNEEVLSNFPSLNELGVELANKIRSNNSDSGNSGNSSGKSSSVATIESVLESLRYIPKHKMLSSNRSLNDLKISDKPPTDMRYKSAPSVVLSTYNTQTKAVHELIRGHSSVDLEREESFQVLPDQTMEHRNEVITETSADCDYKSLMAQSDKIRDSQTTYHISSSSSASFIKLNSHISQDVSDGNLEVISPQESPSQENSIQINNLDNKQTNEITLSTKLQDIIPLVNLPGLAYSDFITPTNPFANTTFLTDMDSQESIASVHPHTVDFDTVLAPDQSMQPFTNEYQIEKVPSHYTVDVCKIEVEDVAEEDTFLPLTPSEFRTFEDYSISKQLEIVSLPQSSVVSPSKPIQDTLTQENIEFGDEREARNDATKFDIQQETSFEYINRFVAEVKRFMEKRNVKIPPNIAVEEIIPVPPCDTIITPELPSNVDEMITEIARQKLDELWDDYLQNKSYFSNKPQLIRRNDKMVSADSTISGYNTKLTSSLSDTTLFTSKPARQTRRNHLVLKPRRKPVRRRTREVTNCVAILATQTQPVDETDQIPEDMLLTIKSNSVAFLVTCDEQKSQDCVGEIVPPVAKKLSNNLSLQEACQSFKPEFITNSSLRQIQLQKRRMSRRELAQQLFLIPTANKSIQTHTGDNNGCVAGTFVPFRKKLTKEEIQSQNRRLRKKYPDLRRRRDLTKEQKERGQKMRIRVKSYQKEILDPVRKSLPLLHSIR